MRGRTDIITGGGLAWLGGESVVYSPDVAVPAAVSCSGFAVLELQTKVREDSTLVESTNSAFTFKTLC